MAATDIGSFASIYEIQEEVDRLAATTNTSSQQVTAMLMIALELRALRWSLVGVPPTKTNGDSAIDRLAYQSEANADAIIDTLGDRISEVAGAIDNLEETINPPVRPPLWYRVYRWFVN